MSNDTLPRGIHNAYLFQAFNAVSWQICLGSPLILFARELGAPAVVLGLLAVLIWCWSAVWSEMRQMGRVGRSAVRRTDPAVTRAK